MATKEILTFQIGNYANFVGAHWWNIQEFAFSYEASSEANELNNDILFRQGLDLKGNVTYTPRLLAVDLNGSLGHHPTAGTLYDENEICCLEKDSQNLDNLLQNVPWKKDKIDVIQKDKIEKPEIQKDMDNDLDIESKEYNLSENVTTWTDYLYTRYHPRTINIINEYKMAENKDTFGTYSNGTMFWQNSEFKDEFTDKIRNYIEECDFCQGFQIMFDATNAFGGVSMKCLEYLNDEYSKSVLAIPLVSPKSILFENADEAMTDSIRTTNLAITYSGLAEFSSLFIPLSTNENAWRKLGKPREFPSITYTPDSFYHTSAILASYLDTSTLCYRLKSSNSTCTLPIFCSNMCNNGRKLAAASFSFPFGMYSNQYLIEYLDKFEGNMFTQLSPGSSVGTDYITQTMCIRGIKNSKLKASGEIKTDQMKMAAYKCNSISEMFQLYLQCQNHASLAYVTAIQEPQKIKNPFPREIFHKNLNLEGFLIESEMENDQRIASIPTVSLVESSSKLSDTLESLYREAKRIKINKIHRFKETGLELDEYNEALEYLLQFKDNYEDNSFNL